MAEDEEYSQAMTRYLRSIDLSKQPTYIQLGIGGTSGWITGIMAVKVGKVLAAAVGGSFLLINVIGTRAGYVKVDWERVEDDVQEATQELTSYINNSAMKDFVDQVAVLVRRNVVTASGFAAGFFLGIAT